MNKLTTIILTLFICLFITTSIVPAVGEDASDVEWTLDNANGAFKTDIVLPENAIQYKTELTAQLTKEQAENFQDGMAVIYVPNVTAGEHEKAIQGICYLPVELADDYQLKAVFSGLYVSVEEKMSENLQAQLVTTRPILMSRQEELGEEKAVLSLKGVFYGELDVIYSPFIININFVENKAQIESVSLDKTEREPLNGYYSAYRYTYVMDENTELPHFLDMEATSWTLWYENKIGSSRTIELRPVSGAGCKVLFSITNKDGTGYSLLPTDYD